MGRVKGEVWGVCADASCLALVCASSTLCDCRVEMSLKTKSGSASWTQLGQLKKGDVVRGHFGTF